MRSVRSFPLHKLRVIKRRFVQELDNRSVVALKNLKKHKQVLAGESKKEKARGLEACMWLC